MQPVHGKEQGSDAPFFTNAGTTLATWGLGSSLLVLHWFARGQTQALPLILGPVAIGALVLSLCSRSEKKREDASHIHVLALAGAIAPFSLADVFHYGIAAALALINIFNFRRPLHLSPVGPTIVFVALLAPTTRNPFAVACLCSAILVFTATIARRERQVATSVFPLLASLHLAASSLDGDALLAGLALAHIGFVLYFRARRERSGTAPTERRALLDDVVVAVALSLALRSIGGLDAHSRYVIVATLFLLGGGLRRGVLALRTAAPVHPRLRWLWNPVMGHAALRMRSNIVASGLCLVAAMRAWPLNYGYLQNASVRVTVILLLASALHLLGTRLGSSVQRDSAKLLLLYSTISMYLGINGEKLPDVGLGTLCTAGFLQFAAIGLTVFSSARDLGLRGDGAWQGIFSGRALAMIRRTRSRVFDVVSQAPLVGWMFHLGDKAATNLHGTFGKTKTWTISHYAICISVGLGLLAAGKLVHEIAVNRYPDFGIPLLTIAEEKNAKEFRAPFVQLVATVGYTGVVFFIGAVCRLVYLRSLALVLACFMLAISAFAALDNRSPISIFYYPLAFCCLMAIFRIFYKSDEVAKMSKGGSRESDV